MLDIIRKCKYSCYYSKKRKCKYGQCGAYVHPSVYISILSHIASTCCLLSCVYIITIIKRQSSFSTCNIHFMSNRNVFWCLSHVVPIYNKMKYITFLKRNRNSAYVSSM